MFIPYYIVMKKINWSILISLIALGLSIISLCNVYPRELGLDYIGLIVGILALITAILLGWQIFILFDINSIKKDMLNTETNIHLDIERRLSEMQLGLMIHYEEKIVKTNSDLFSFAHHGISSLIHLSRIGEISKCADVIGLILHYSDDLKKMKISQTQKESLKTLLLSVENPKRLPQLTDLAAVLN